MPNYPTPRQDEYHRMAGKAVLTAIGGLANWRRFSSMDTRDAENPAFEGWRSLCRAAAARRIKRTWDLWPLAAETAKEPTSCAGRFQGESRFP